MYNCRCVHVHLYFSCLLHCEYLTCTWVVHVYSGQIEWATIMVNTLTHYGLILHNVFFFPSFLPLPFLSVSFPCIRSCLHYASPGGHLEVVRELLKNGAERDRPSHSTDRYSTCIHSLHRCNLISFKCINKLGWHVNSLVFSPSICTCSKTWQTFVVALEQENYFNMFV